MKCKCGNDFGIRLAAKADCQGCQLLTSMTTILTVQCAQCRAVFQVPLTSEAVVIQKHQGDKEEDSGDEV
jgi:hypothetical protein